MQTLDVLREQVEAQKLLVPSLYGQVDFSLVPERFCTEPDVKSMLPADLAGRLRGKVLADAERVERLRLYTLLGDTVCDRYAALMTQGRTMRELIGLLHQAWASGVENLPDAPPELAAFMHAMEQVPDWIDMDLVREGQRVSRNYMANLTPFAIRGAFIATFMNKYSGLPMALTGALTRNGSGEQRINETASFFTAYTLPHALERRGAGFMAAAMVRLMHSVVRFNLLTHSGQWDLRVYGIPVPQIDQMPAGTMPSFLNAFAVIQAGKKHFNRRQRAVAELCRYQSHLLGLPQELLPATPQEIFDVMVAYAATLRDGYDDATCGRMVRSTVAAYRPKTRDLRSRIYNRVETGFSKVFFRRMFLRGQDTYKAAMMGVEPSFGDYVLFAVANGYILPRLLAHRLLEQVPVVTGIADRFLIRDIRRLLGEYGHAEYITDLEHYPAGGVKPVFGQRGQRGGARSSVV